MVIQHNISALSSMHNLNIHNDNVSKALRRLSSGNRINSAADDAAGMGISERMKMQLTMLDRQQMNVQDAASVADTADGALNEVGNMLNRMNELSIEAMNGIFGSSEREKLDAEYQQLLDEIDHIGKSTAFGSMNLFPKKTESDSSSQSKTETIKLSGGNINAYLDGLDDFLLKISKASSEADNETLKSLGLDPTGEKSGNGLHEAVIRFTKENAEKLLSTPPANGKALKGDFIVDLDGGDITIKLPEVGVDALGLGDTNLLTTDGAANAQEAVKKALNSVMDYRGSFGALSNRLEHTSNLLSTMQENLTAAISRITDADMAKEMLNFTREKALVQVAQFAMVHANQEPQNVLKLIQDSM